MDRHQLTAALLLFVLAGGAFAQIPSTSSVPSINSIRNAAYCADTSVSANTITCATAVGFTGYAAGQAVDVLLANSATAATTINVNGLGAKAVTYNGATVIIAGVLVAGGTYRFQYDGVRFVLQGTTSSSGGSGSGGGLVTYAALAVVLSGGTTPVFVPLGGDGLGSTTEADVQMKVQPASTIQNLCVNLSAAPGMGNSLAVTLRVGAANKALTVTISNTATSACDSTHTFTNAAGDLMDWSLVPSGAIALFTPNVMISAQWGTLNAGSVNAGTINQTAFYAAAGSTLSGVGPGSAGDAYISNGSGSPPSFQSTANAKIRTIGAHFGSFESGATALTGALTACVTVYYAGTITAAEIIGDVSGSVTIDVLTVAHASWTGTASASSITAAAIPALSSAAAFTDTTLTGWTTAVTANTDFCFAMTSPTTVAGVAIALKVTAN